MRYHKPSFLTKLILYGLSMGLIPVLVIGFFSYYQASGAIQAKVNEANLQNLHQVQTRVEQVLKTVDQLAIQFISSPMVYSALGQEIQPKDFKLAADLFSGINNLQSFALGVHNVYLVSNQSNWIMNSRGVVPFDQAQDKERFLAFMGNKKSSFWTTSAAVGSGPGGESSPTLYFVKKIPVHSSIPTGLLVMEIPFFEINNLLPATGAQTMLLLDEHHVALAHGNPERIGADQSDEGYIEALELQQQTSGYFQSEAEETDVWVTYSRSAYNGWYYIAVTSIRDITKDSKSIAYVTLFTCFIMILFAVSISYISSKKLYTPLRTLTQFASNLKTPSTVAGADEWHLLSHKFHSLSDQVNDQVRQLQQFFLFKLFQGEMSSREIEEQLLKHGEDPAKWQDCVVTAIQIHNLKDTRYNESDKDLLLFAVNNIVSELIAPEYLFDTIVLNNTLLVLLRTSASVDDGFALTVDRLCLSMQEAVQRYLTLTLHMGVSRRFGYLPHAPVAYRESLDALTYGMRLNETTISHIEEIRKDPLTEERYPVQPELDLLDAVRLGDGAIAEQQLDLFMRELQQAKLSQSMYRYFIQRLIMSLLRLLQHEPGFHNQSVENGMLLAAELQMLKTTDEACARIKEALLVPIAVYFREQQEGSRSVSNEMIRLIERNNANLTLEACAKALNYHPDYLKRLFKLETGSSFSDYLSDYRLILAKRWLLESSMTISEIAEKLDYNSTTNFIRYFRNKEGITPGKYREMNSHQ
ncbi:MAG: hypothetical protein K0R57_5627 [Paenibacillaceae bacterium]|jgi:AraC-like DNA-binding protein|nr:hypothetical protein [Paenibacillaceae bacterium]